LPQGTLKRIDAIDKLECADRIDNIITDYFTEKSFSVYDSFHNEILFIDPSKNFTIVLNLNDFSYSIRKDMMSFMFFVHNQFSGTVSINNKDILFLNFTSYLALTTDYFYFYNLDETKAAKSISHGIEMTNYINNIPNSVVLFATTTMFSPNYMKVEHLIARFLQNASENRESNIYLFVIGSRDGVEWKIVSKGRITNLDKMMQGIQIRRCFTSCRYFQFVFAKKDVGRYSGEDRLLNNFSGFSFDFQACDSKKPR